MVFLQSFEVHLELAPDYECRLRCDITGNFSQFSGTFVVITIILVSRVAENLPCNRDCRASPASQANTFSSLNFASEQNGSPEDRYFSFYITH